ncbi:MAG: PqqD family protein [Haliea sp.]|nr:PqqD family protein [Haliea sp.]
MWDRLSHTGASAEQLVAELELHFNSPVAEIAAGVNNFLAQLRDESLIEPGDNTGAAAASSAAPAATSEFEAPQLNKYTDMEALLLADPIHEVEPEGWPHVKS